MRGRCSRTTLGLTGLDELLWWRWLWRSADVGRINTLAGPGKRSHQSRRARRTTWHRPRHRRRLHAFNRYPGQRTTFSFGDPRHRAMCSSNRQITPRAAVLDFSARSSTPRFHLIDRASGQVLQSFRVSQDMARKGSATMATRRFSPTFLGAMPVASGSTGPAEPMAATVPWTRDAPERSVAHELECQITIYRYPRSPVHGPGVVERKEDGRPGRSDGCFVFSKADRDAVIANLQGGALIYAIYEKPR